MTWEDAKKEYVIGQKIEGKVIYKTPFGDFIDLDVNQEFTVLIQIIDIFNLTEDIYKSGNYHPLGSIISGIIIDFRDHNKQIIFSQKTCNKGN